MFETNADGEVSAFTPQVEPAFSPARFLKILAAGVATGTNTFSLVPTEGGLVAIPQVHGR